MARPQQVKYRRKRQRGEYDDVSVTSNITTSINLADVAPNPDEEAVNDGETDPTAERNPRSQCLPVADLPEGFDGVPLDGAQFLALANRTNESLPFVTRVENPYKESSPVEEEVRGIEVGDDDDRGEGSSSMGKRVKQKHPALQRDSWGVLFPIHYEAYRKDLASRWPPSSQLPYPASYPRLPEASRRSEWYMFVNGYEAIAEGQRNGKGKKKVVEVDEEEALNSRTSPVTTPHEAEGSREKLRGQVREPLVGVLQQLNASQTIRVLGHFAYWLHETISQIPPSPDLLPTQPDDYTSDVLNPSLSTSPASSRAVPNPLPVHYFNWIFALILTLPPQLSSDEISTLRELARAAMHVAGWRWIRGVVLKDVGDGWRLGGRGWLKTNKRRRNMTPIPIPIPIPNDDVERIMLDVEQELTTEQDVKESRAVPSKLESDLSLEDEDTVDETLARCWIIVNSVAIGWGQKDLLDEMEKLFS
ncbi:hypothetical protein IAR55_002168 [Kwoniella newhampshirensis]|uniref:Uncharacterized protein n=1 Tax=Kwoniella newhampshirensis TaxID=1651941 RepID=A0AAW0Z0R3_9TREE